MGLQEHCQTKRTFRAIKVNPWNIYMPDRADLQIAPKNIVNPYSIEQVIEVLTSVGFADVVYYSEHGYYIKAKKATDKTE